MDDPQSVREDYLRRKNARYSAEDPASLLPFSCQLSPSDPKVERLPMAFRGTIAHKSVDTFKVPANEAA